MSFIELKEVNKSFNQNQILNDISLSIEKGDFFGIVGPSGAGKSVLMKTLLGIYLPDKGQVIINSKNIEEDKSLKNIIGFVPQNSSLYPDLSVFSNMKYFGKLYGMKLKDIKERSKILLGDMGLSSVSNKKLKSLSGGMNRRVNIACSMLHNPAILILDEPLSGLDPLLRKQILDLILRIQQTGKTIIISSHFMNELESLCNKVAVISNGEIATVGGPKEIRDKYSPYYEVKIRTYPGKYKSLLEALKRNGVLIQKVEMSQRDLILYLPKSANPRTQLGKIVSTSDKYGESLLEIGMNTLSFAEVYREIVQ